MIFDAELIAGYFREAERGEPPAYTASTVPLVARLGSSDLAFVDDGGIIEQGYEFFDRVLELHALPELGELVGSGDSDPEAGLHGECGAVYVAMVLEDARDLFELRAAAGREFDAGVCDRAAHAPQHDARGSLGLNSADGSVTLCILT